MLWGSFGTYSTPAATLNKVKGTANVSELCGCSCIARFRASEGMRSDFVKPEGLRAEILEEDNAGEDFVTKDGANPSVRGTWSASVATKTSW